MFNNCTYKHDSENFVTIFQILFRYYININISMCINNYYVKYTNYNCSTYHLIVCKGCIHSYLPLIIFLIQYSNDSEFLLCKVGFEIF